MTCARGRHHQASGRGVVAVGSALVGESLSKRSLLFRLEQLIGATNCSCPHLSSVLVASRCSQSAVQSGAT